MFTRNQSDQQRSRRVSASSSGNWQSLEQSKGVTEREVADIEERAQPRTPVIYEIVRRLGEEEMARPVVSLWWSRVAAGVSLSFFLLAQAILYVHLPDAIWRPLITGFGYSVGFLMVVLSRQQLFTENAITVVLPVMEQFSVANLGRLGRLWRIVLRACKVVGFVKLRVAQRGCHSLKNLLSNAFKFTEQGGVKLNIYRATGGWSPEHPILKNAPGVVAFEVSDTGIGISPEKQKIVFEAFQISEMLGSTSMKLPTDRSQRTLRFHEL
jgi:hypothetical protein